MTESLNRKLDLLLRSGTCPQYLLDVLTLLVAHANETELFKKELRSAPFESAVLPRVQQTLSACTEGTTVARVPSKSQPDSQTEVGRAASHTEESIVVAAEKSLRSYAMDLKNINDIAIATASKKLREMKQCNFTEMADFRDRLVKDMVRQCRAELDSLRISWLESVNRDVARLETEIHQVGLASQKQLSAMLEGCSDYMSKGFQLLNNEPLESTHRALAECAFCVERVKRVEQQMVPRVEIDRLYERIKNIECIITQRVGDAPTGIQVNLDTPHRLNGSEPEMPRTAATPLKTLDHWSHNYGVVTTK